MRSVEGARRLTTAEVKTEAKAAGFDLCGVAPVADFPELNFLTEWLARGYAGEMHYMRRTADRRADVRAIMPSARSVISLGVVYNTERPYSTQQSDPAQAAIARYAWGDDYHVVIEQRLARLIERLRELSDQEFDARSYVDTGPVQERVYAQYAGLGWIGKNTCLINEDLGSWIFLSEIICSLPLEADAPGFDQCGSCERCLEACPTGALVDAGVLDSTRCISYLTIELKGAIPDEHRAALGRHAYGCDICQEVCPWNIAPGIGKSRDEPWQARPGLDDARLLDLWRRSDDELRTLLKGSAMKRAGVKRLRRNLAIALGNSDNPDAAIALAACREETARDPLVAEHVAWAIEKLGA
jgi:epoxyqueuosine reductase